MKKKKYDIATENSRTGHAVDTLRAIITLGLKKGYEGFVQEKIEVLNFLTDLYKVALTEGRNYIPFVVTESVITYAYPGDNGPIAAHEPALVLTSDKSPLYAADMSDQQWSDMVEFYAHALGAEFDQFRVYVTYTRVEVKIFQEV